MKHKIFFNFVMSIVIIAVFFSQEAFAYVGPGTGLSAIGAFLALIVGVFVTVMGFLWYPVKRLLGKKKLQEPDQKKNEDE